MPPEPVRPGTPDFSRLRAAMVAAGLAGFGLLYATQPLLPLIAREFGTGAATTSLALSAATGTLALAVVPVTVLAERFGRVRVMRAGLVAAVLLMLCCAASPSLGVLVGLRAAVGVAVAAVVAVAMGHVGAVVTTTAVGAAMGLYVAGTTLGGVGGRVLGGVVGDVAGWRVADVVVALVLGIAAAAFWLLLPADPPGAYTGSGVPTLRETARVVRTHARDRSVRRLLVVPATLMGGFVATYNYLSFRLAEPPFSLSTAAVGAVFVAYLSGTVTSALAGGGRRGRSGRPPGRRALLVWIGVMAAGLALTLPDALPVVVAGLLVLTGGFFGAHAVASGWMPALARRAAPGSPTAPASGLYLLAYYAGSSVFGTLVGPVWGRFGWPGTVAAVGVLLLVAVVAAAGLPDGYGRSRSGTGGLPVTP